MAENKYKRIVIIGMTCSGKSSIGKIIAAHYGLDFYDLDAEIESYAGMTIEEIFRQSGEAEFRRIESEVTIKMAGTDNAVIATGGGIVTRANNMAHLKKPDSLVMYIHRDFYKIATTPKRVMDKRPVLRSTSYEKLFAIYKQRLPLYKKYADVEVQNDTNKEESVKEIIATLDKIFAPDPEPIYTPPEAEEEHIMTVAEFKRLEAEKSRLEEEEKMKRKLIVTEDE